MSNEWVMVPREPTANQLVDGAYEVPDPISHRGELTARMVYRAMLDAAPAAPAGHDFIAHEYRKGFIDGQISMREQLSPAAPQQAEPRDVCDVCNALTVPRNATRYDADDLKAAQVRGKIIAARLQQAEPVAQIGWSDEFGNLFPMAAWKPAQRTHHDSHKTAWRPVFLHPPAAEVQQAEPVGDFQRSAPGKIWMNLGNDGMDEIEYPTWDALVRADENITWSEDRIDATDIPYVRADLAHPPAAEVQRLRAAALALLNELDAGRHGAHEFNNLRNALRGHAI